MCSRFPLPRKDSDNRELADSEKLFGETERDSGGEGTESVFLVYIGDDKPLLNCVLIAKLSRTDLLVSRVIHYTLEGWPERLTTVRNKTESGDSSAEARQGPNSVMKTRSG